MERQLFLRMLGAAEARLGMWLLVLSQQPLNMHLKLDMTSLSHLKEAGLWL